MPASRSSKKRRVKDDDDDDDSRETQKTKEKPKSRTPLILGLSAGGLILVLLVAGGLFLLLGKSKSTEAAKGSPTRSTKTTAAGTGAGTPAATSAKTPPKAGGIPEGWVVFEQPLFTCWLKQAGSAPLAGTKPGETGSEPEYVLTKYNIGNRSHTVTIISLDPAIDQVQARRFMEAEVERRINILLEKPTIDKRRDVTMDRITATEWVATGSDADACTIVFRFFLERGRIFILAAGGNALPESDSYVADFFRGFKLKN